MDTSSIDLNRLKVSLTKNGYQKVWILLRDFEAAAIPHKSRSGHESIYIDTAQVTRMLSLDRKQPAYSLWNTVRADSIGRLKKAVFLACLLSHNDLIECISRSAVSPGLSKVKRTGGIGLKSFTNFRYAYSQLADHSQDNPRGDFFYIDWQPFLEDGVLGRYLFEIVHLKLLDAGWNGDGAVTDAACSAGLFNIFAISESDFRVWLEGNDLTESEVNDGSPYIESDTIPEFSFTGGNRVGAKETKIINRKVSRFEIAFLHTRIQAVLFDHLAEALGEENVSSEAPTGYGGAIDLVSKGAVTTFYEVKTAGSARGCIRQGIGQALEYMHWPSASRCGRLAIVGPVAPTKRDIQYLTLIRERYQIPIWYIHVDLDSGTISQLQ